VFPYTTPAVALLALALQRQIRLRSIAVGLTGRSRCIRRLVRVAVVSSRRFVVRRLVVVCRMWSGRGLRLGGVRGRSFVGIALRIG
jgi:hypothetical protein